MSNRYNIYLKNNKTGEEHYHQLFGNNEWYETFAQYLKSIGANTDDEWIERTKVPDLLELVKAIDETVWTDIIYEGPITKQKSLRWFDEIEMYSPYLDFTPNFILHNKETGDPIVYSPIYQVANTLANQAYIFASYSLVNWLEKHDAIEDTKIRFTKHSYMVENTFHEQGEPIIIGDLKPEFELYISYN
jgi:hypothetical protein